MGEIGESDAYGITITTESLASANVGVPLGGGIPMRDTRVGREWVDSRLRGNDVEVVGMTAGLWE